MTPALVNAFVALAASLGVIALCAGAVQFVCWLRYRHMPLPPTGCELPAYISPERAAQNEKWLWEHDPACAALFAQWDADDARTGRRQYSLDEVRRVTFQELNATHG